ncbi:hypothetical protein KP509_13G074400 [Ceratopteris richardii]|uniref:RING-type E3 ubiquitin transferase n=1 Tax=Ceratopteris richardii TaxID=49495 RepID=A0A8T2TGZ7_CERRI|nr:hypothetical protein KP509_13G074400 [Ceratopteris richardii]
MSNPSRHKRRHFGVPLVPPLESSGCSLIKSLINLANDIVNSSAARSHKAAQSALFVSQRRNAFAMVRKVKILLIFFEEVRDTSSILPPSAILCFGELHVVLQGVKLLLDDCVESSRMWLMLENHRLSEGFHRLTLNIATSLEILPMSLLDLSCEVREQVGLLLQQARKSQIHLDPDESKLLLKVKSLMSQIERKETPNTMKLREVFTSLGLNSGDECQSELGKLEEELEGSQDTSEEANFLFNDLLSFIRYGKCVLYGVSELQLKEIAESPENPNFCEDVVVPEDFRCPISLDIMTDPVIIATGHTYERSSITRWIEEGNHTCPKSGLMMAHTVLIPNEALRNLIQQWCDEFGISISPSEPINPGIRAPQSTPTSLEATKLTVDFLLLQLSSASAETQRHIAGELRLLAKCGSDNRKVIGEAGAVPLLIPLLSSSDVRTQEHAVTAILNLSIFTTNKEIIVSAGAIDPLVKVLSNSLSSDAARENSAAALFSLTHVADYAELLCQKSEAIDGLLQLLCEGSLRGKRDAASALFNISAYSRNPINVVKSGAVEVLVSLLSPSESDLHIEALSVLAVLAGSPDGCAAIVNLNTIPLLVNLLHSSSPKGKENSVSILLNLCRYVGQPVVKEITDLCSFWPSLHSLANSGTDRARRKASRLWRVIRKMELAPISFFGSN